MTWYLDTNICIECLRGKAPLIKEALQSLEPSRVNIPSMVMAELLHGALKSSKPEANQRLVELFIEPFETVDFDAGAAIQYSKIRNELESSGQVIGFNDLIIASTVMAHGGTLVSSNIKEFKRIRGLSLENWQEVLLGE